MPQTGCCIGGAWTFSAGSKRASASPCPGARWASTWPRPDFAGCRCARSARNPIPGPGKRSKKLRRDRSRRPAASRPLWDKNRVVWNQGVGGANLLCVHTFIPAHPRHPGPAPTARALRGRKGAGGRRARYAGSVGQCAGPGTEQIPARTRQQTMGDCPDQAAESLIHATQHFMKTILGVIAV